MILLVILLITPGVRAMETAEAPDSCQLCGMNLSVYARSRIQVSYSEGTVVYVCSLHCAALDMTRNSVKKISSLKVADYSSNTLLDARTAAWVIGGKAEGVMTALAKWAFSTVEAARRFAQENGGAVSSFEQAMNAATSEVLEQAAEEKAVESEILSELQR